uniref:Uncharacterized protein n=1 Tax=Fundulus heteroclitus TaxID=8078 RepID=A0A3Q2PZL8_FUNHE
MKNKRQDVDPENLKRDLDEPTSPTVRQRDSSRGRHREKEDIKITKERTPASEEEPAEWEANREDSDIGDYDYELSLEMKRQKIQRELLKLEQENLDKRDDIVIKKDETPNKTRGAVLPKVRNVSGELLSSKDSPTARKTAASPKHKSGAKGAGSGKKEKKSSVALAVSETTRATKAGHSKKKGPRTPSPPPPVPLDLPVVGKKHKGKHKNKEKTEEKLKEGKDRGRDTEKHKEKKEKRRSAVRQKQFIIIHSLFVLLALFIYLFYVINQHRLVSFFTKTNAFVFKLVESEITWGGGGMSLCVNFHVRPQILNWFYV